MNFVNSTLIIVNGLTYNDVNGKYTNNTIVNIPIKNLVKGYAGQVENGDVIQFILPVLPVLSIGDQFELFDKNGVLKTSGQIKKIMPHNSYWFS